MAIILLLGAVVKIQSAVNMKRLHYPKWYLVLIAAVVIIALAVLLLANPFDTERHMLIYIGVCLILDGMTNLVSLLCIQIRVRKLARIQRDNPDADLRTLLEQKQKKTVAPAEYADVQEPGKRQE